MSKPQSWLPRSRVALVVAGIAGSLLGMAPISQARASAAVPPGFHLVSTESLGPGVEHWTLRQDQPSLDVHVARLAPGTGRQLVPMLARDVLAGPSAGLETTSSMCARAKCLVAVNGDFWDRDGQPIGAMIAGGELIATPTIDHIFLRLDGRGRPTLRPGIDWSVGVRTGDGQSQAVQAVNRSATADGITLYSRRWGATTGTVPGAVEVALEFVLPSSPVLPSGGTTVRVGPPETVGNAAISPGKVVLSGQGAGGQAIAALAQRAAATGGLATLNVNVAGAYSAIGGSPQLLQDGRPAYPTENADSFTQARHPRTMVGITGDGEILLITADGSPTSAGLTLREATSMLAGLGATHAINLDGGGSTTFVTGGIVRNRPRDGERPVVSALALTAAPDAVTALLNEVATTVNELLQPLGL